MQIQVFYSPQADEEPNSSAACEYSKRINGLINPSSQDDNVVISLHRLDLESINKLDETSKSGSCLNVFIISCSADGSVDRVVRKLVRNMKSSTISGETDDLSCEELPIISSKRFVALALLGHARCENSAQQMKDTIFNTGRKFGKQMQEYFKDSQFADRLEVQAELDGPEMSGGFDEWVQQSINSVLS